MSWYALHVPDIDKGKRLIRALVSLCGGEFRGKTRLNKAFWWAHVYHWKHHSGLLSKYPIARLPEGPAIERVDDLLASLVRDGCVSVEDQLVGGGYLETVIRGAGGCPDLDEDEVDSLKNAIAWLGTKTAAAVSKESHDLSRSWNRGKDGDLLDISIDAISDEDFDAGSGVFDQIEGELASASLLVSQVFGGTSGRFAN